MTRATLGEKVCLDLQFQKDRVPSDRKSVAASRYGRQQQQEANWSEHSCTQEVKNKLEGRCGYKPSKSTPQGCTPCNKGASPKDSITSPKGAAIWRASIPTEDPMGDISPSNCHWTFKFLQ